MHKKKLTSVLWILNSSKKEMKYSILSIIKELVERGDVRQEVSLSRLRGSCEEILILLEGEKKRGRPRKEKKEEGVSGEDVISRLMSESDITESDEVKKVKRCVILGKDYLISKENEVFCPESHDSLGYLKNGDLIRS